MKMTLKEKVYAIGSFIILILGIVAGALMKSSSKEGPDKKLKKEIKTQKKKVKSSEKKSADSVKKDKIKTTAHEKVKLSTETKVDKLKTSHDERKEKTSSFIKKVD